MSTRCSRRSQLVLCQTVWIYQTVASLLHFYFCSWVCVWYNVGSHSSDLQRYYWNTYQSSREAATAVKYNHYLKDSWMSLNIYRVDLWRKSRNALNIHTSVEEHDWTLPKDEDSLERLSNALFLVKKKSSLSLIVLLCTGFLRPSALFDIWWTICRAAGMVEVQIQLIVCTRSKSATLNFSLNS